ncbi:MAG: thrombospondin type-1 domain-containing protein [Myxococcota bacterium]
MPSKFIELVLVSDVARFNRYQGNTASRALALANIADAFLRNGDLTPSIGVTVKGQAVFTSTVPYTWTTLPSSEASASSLLSSFSTWAYTNTAPAGTLPKSDYRVLVSGLDFDGSTVSLGGVGVMCHPENGAIVQGTFSSDAYEGFLLVHELGHALGTQHDTGAAGTACDATKFIMASATCANCPGILDTHWSSCSQQNLATFLAHLPHHSCLDDVPTTFWNDLHRCGNGIVDPGERCDCGDTDCSVNDPCCDGATCQLVAGAACATLDGCCDACQVATTQRLCRAAATPCDQAAVCNGIDPTCPPTLHLDGTACNDGLSVNGGTCYDGICVSMAAQCAAFANQGYPITGLTTCQYQSAFNSGNPCNVIYCGVNNDPTSCTSFTTASGSALVEDGAACAAGKQCVDQACVTSSSIQEVRTPYRFETSDWSACSAPCGPGTQTRRVVCVDAQGRPLPLASCAGAAPAASQGCNLGPCTTYSWRSSDWSQCSKACGGGTQSRTVACVNDATQAVVPDASCDAQTKPASQSACNTDPCLDYAWVTSDFGACSVACGVGVHTRTVTCVELSQGVSLDDAACAGIGPKPATSEACAPTCGDGYACLAGACTWSNPCTLLPSPCGRKRCENPRPGAHTCHHPTCSDGQRDGHETGVDCGGSCDACGAGEGCARDRDCESRVCDEDTCQAASCDDDTRNGDETDVDCGGVCGATCSRGDTCRVAGDCRSNLCIHGQCALPLHCKNHVRDADETGRDCGGATCDACRGH